MEWPAILEIIYIIFLASSWYEWVFHLDLIYLIPISMYAKFLEWIKKCQHHPVYRFRPTFNKEMETLWGCVCWKSWWLLSLYCTLVSVLKSLPFVLARVVYSEDSYWWFPGEMMVTSEIWRTWISYVERCLASSKDCEKTDLLWLLISLIQLQRFCIFWFWYSFQLSWIFSIPSNGWLS